MQAQSCDPYGRTIDQSHVLCTLDVFQGLCPFKASCHGWIWSRLHPLLRIPCHGDFNSFSIPSTFPLPSPAARYIIRSQCVGWYGIWFIRHANQCVTFRPPACRVSNFHPRPTSQHHRPSYISISLWSGEPVRQGVLIACGLEVMRRPVNPKRYCNWFVVSGNSKIYPAMSILDGTFANWVPITTCLVHNCFKCSPVRKTAPCEIYTEWNPYQTFNGKRDKDLDAAPT